jgi:hypothetical protein
VTSTFVFARASGLARIGAILLAALSAACSSSVSGPTPVDDPARITIQPDTATLYSGLQTTFTVSGGTGTYAISSSNQAVVQVPSFLNGRTFSVTPANVLADTTVTISVRDSGTAPVVTAALTVRPGTVANDITVVPTPTQGGNCTPAVCSGGDATVVATLSQGGNPLPARGVRLDVVSGDFRFIVSPPGQNEVLATTTTVVSDQAGNVLQRLRALPGAPNQTAVVQVTDLGTSAFRRTTFSIAQATGGSPGFFVVPDELTFTGPNNLSCASGVRGDVAIFGGSPPYTIGNGGTAFSVSQNTISQSGGSFYVVANGVCADNIPIPVVDSAGRTTNVTVSNVFGTNAVPDLVVSPTTVTLSECSSQAAVTVAGGIPGNFIVSTNSTALTTSYSPSGRIINIGRAANQVAASPIQVGVASGDKVATITVNLTGDALNTRCDGSNLTVTPNSMTIAGCGTAEAVISGGTGTYFANSNLTSVTAAVVGDILRVTRVPGSPVPDDPGTVTVRDSSTSVPPVARPVTVTVSGICP